jgi:hypothetical protein
MTDELARQLHDRATRGEELTPAEKSHLEAWYARQDEEEARLLAKVSPSPTAAGLRNQVNAALAQVVTATQRIQTLADENEALRREIAALQRQLARQPSAQPA